jgi:hypothetical protein
MELCFFALNRLEAEGFRLAHVGELAAELARLPLPASGPLIEIGGGSKSGLAEGRRRRGRLRRSPGDELALSAVWRHRMILRGVEQERGSGGDSSPWLHAAKKLQYLSEAGTPWIPPSLNPGTPVPQHPSEAVLAICARIGQAVVPSGIRFTGAAPETAGPIGAEVYGTTGKIAWQRLDEMRWLCEAFFQAGEDDCGIRFRRSDGDVYYSPSGDECAVACVPLEDLASAEVDLPAVNGLVSLTPDLFVIRCNWFWAGGVTIFRDEPWLAFGAGGGAEIRTFEWCFVIVRCSPTEAVQEANRINRI